MSQDPNQPPTGYGSDPQNPYGSPPPQNPYGASPQGPYGPTPQPPPQQGPYGPPPQGPYGQPPQNPYGPPPQQGPYGPPPQGPYGQPPQNPYGPQQQQGAYAPAAGYAYSGQGGYQVPLQPLPLGDAVQQLPNQYINAITHPAVETFAAEIPKSSWDITWIQLLILAVGAAVIGLISALLVSATMSSLMAGSMGSFGSIYSSILVSTSVGGALSRIIFVPIAFFIGQGIQYLLAKAFKGQGTFLVQSYTALLYLVPTTILSYLVGLIFNLIPVVGFGIAGLLQFAIWIYSVVLNVFQLRAAHRLGTSSAVAVALIPLAVAIVFGLICVLAFAALIFQMMHPAQPSYP